MLPMCRILVSKHFTCVEVVLSFDLITSHVGNEAREVGKFSQVYRASKWLSWDLNSSSLAPESCSESGDEYVEGEENPG